MAGPSSASEQALGQPHNVFQAFASLGPSATRGRLAVLATLRTAMPVFVFLALTISSVPFDRSRIAALLSAQIAFGFASLSFAARQRPAVTTLAVWASICVDVTVLSALTWTSGGAGGPLTFLFAVEALAVAIVFSASAGVRVLGVSLAIIASFEAVQPAESSAGLEAVAGTILLAIAGIALIAYTQAESRRRALELAAIRRITLDIQDSLSLREILADLCRGVVNDLRFTSAAVLLRENEHFVCAGSCGVNGARAKTIPVRGGLAQALRAGQLVIMSREQALRENELTDVVGSRGYIAIPMGTEGVLVVTRAPRKRLFVRLRGGGRVRAHELEPLMSLAQQAALTVANARLHEHVAAMAVTDPLTELANHREFQRVLNHECERQRRYGSSPAAGHHLSVLLLDIDHFKSINDRFGHPAGDDVLRAVALTLRHAVRSFDVVARYGGEEFGVVLPETDEHGALAVAERARAAVASLSLVVDGKRVKVTVSVGAATAPEDGLTGAQLVAAADAALYQSKADGRDRVTHAAECGRRVTTRARRRHAQSA